MQGDKAVRPREATRADCVCLATFTGLICGWDCGLAGSPVPLAHLPIAVERL